MGGPPQTTTPQGYTKADYLTDSQIDWIVDQIASGINPVTACAEAGTSHSQFRRRCRRDPIVNQRAQQAREEGHPELIERVRHERDYHIFVRHDYKAVKDFLMIYDPDWEKLRIQRFEIGNVPGEQFVLAAKAAFGDLTLEEIEARIRLLETREKDQHPVYELPRAVEE